MQLARYSDIIHRYGKTRGKELPRKLPNPNVRLHHWSMTLKMGPNGNFLIRCLLICCCMVLARSCTCGMQHRQTHFCGADFVIKARLKGKELLYNEYPGIDFKEYETIQRREFMYQQRYTMRIMKIYKGETALKNITQHFLHTELDDGLCGVTFQLRMKYVIFGNVYNGKMYTDICRQNVAWNRLHVRERKALNLYGKQCDHCLVTPCWRRDCPKGAKPNTCIWDVTHYASDCYNMYSVCVKHGKELCKWSKNSSFRDCYKTEKRAYFAEP